MGSPPGGVCGQKEKNHKEDKTQYIHTSPKIFCTTERPTCDLLYYSREVLEIFGVLFLFFWCVVCFCLCFGCVDVVYFFVVFVFQILFFGVCCVNRFIFIFILPPYIFLLIHSVHRLTYITHFIYM